jgi:DNA repair exonuclease SbcCD ATPase subunit
MPSKQRPTPDSLPASHTQVIAISHHRKFLEVADHIVRLHAADGRTVATSDRYRIV